jgi:hypothetical protein
MRKVYTVKMQSGDIWLFKYNLKGVLVFFDVLEGDLTDKQEKFLYLDGKFPWKEAHIETWKKLYKTIAIEVGELDISFKALWNLYDNKVSKFDAEKAFNKLSDADKIKCFLVIPGYKKYLAKKGTGTAHLATFIHRQYYNDEWSKAA